MTQEQAANYLHSVDGQWIVEKAADFVMAGDSLSVALQKAQTAYMDFCCEMAECKTKRAITAKEYAAYKTYSHFND